MADLNAPPPGSLRPNIPPVADDLLLQGRHAEAIPHLEAFVQENPHDLGRWAILLMTYDYCQKGPGACDAATRLVIAIPEEPDAWNMAGEIEGRYGNPRLAARFFRQGIRLGGGSAETWKNLSICYSNAGREDLALKAMWRAHAINPSDPLILEILIKHFPASASPARLIQLCKALLRIDPRNPIAWEHLGLRRLDRQAYARAITAFEHLLVADPSNPHVLPTLAYCHFCLKRYQDATKYYALYLRLHPDDGNAWARVGACHLLLGNTGEGRICIERALQLDPTNPSFISLLDSLDRPSRKN